MPAYLTAIIVVLSAFTSPLLAAPPNIIMILVDDLGWSDVGYAGAPGKLYETPHLDKLAARGVS